MGNQFADQYSLLHFAAGIVAYFWGIPFKYWLIINILYETIENTDVAMKIITKILVYWPGGKKHKDTIVNSVGDIFFACLGWFAAYFLDNYGKKHGWMYGIVTK